MKRLLPVLLTVALNLIALPASGQELMPPDARRQLGLTQAWARPLNVPAGAQSIVDQQLYVHESMPHEYVEIVIPETGRAAAEEQTAEEQTVEKQPADGSQPESGVTGKTLARIPTDQKDTMGKPIGKAEAERLANNQLRRLKRRGIDAVVTSRSVPRVRLYTLANDGTLESRNAETGEPIWVTRLGDPRLPYRAIGVSEKFLTVINGSNLFKVDANTGDVIEDVDVNGAPRFGAVNSGDYAMLPLVGGAVLGFPLDDPTRRPFKEIVAGSALTLPTKAHRSTRVAWPTDRGFVYVMEMQGEPSVLFRLDTDGIVSGRIATATGNRFFFGSESGQVYGILATITGRVLWSRPFGEPFYDEPLVAKEQVLLRSSYGNLHSLDIETGYPTWDRPVFGISDLLVSFDGRLYTTTLSGALAVLDLESGKRVATLPGIRPERLLVNRLTDRLYLVGARGDVQCLRLEDADLPTFNIQPQLEIEEPDEEEAKPEKPPAGPFGGGNNPFDDAGNNPFGGGMDNDNPFGGGADDNNPFGGGDDDANNPFGDNPFGG